MFLVIEAPTGTPSAPGIDAAVAADWIHGRRVVGVPGEVSEQTFRLISSADRQRVELRRLVK